MPGPPTATLDPLYSEALARFADLLDRARHTALREPTAVSLATVSPDGRPSVRIVLLRGYDEQGFVFYTNTTSRKGVELTNNPCVALCFHWDPLGVQVRIEGAVERVSDDEADAYWQGRPRTSQIGAWASQQSATLDRRDTLEQRVRQFTEKFATADVPRPDFWTGFRVTPERLEFWFNRPARLHDRIVYESRESTWSRTTLYP